MENRDTTSQDIRDRIKDIIRYLGENPEREGLKQTPNRVVKSWDTLYGGYKQKPEDILKTQFYDGRCDEIVLLKDIEFYSTCEHHMLPFFGKVHIGYIPSQTVVGISKLARLVEIYSRRLQIQERMTEQIADALMNILKPQGVYVIVEAKHFCMVSRGVSKQNSIMKTSAIRGVFQNQEARSEFLELIK